MGGSKRMILPLMYVSQRVEISPLFVLNLLVGNLLAESSCESFRESLGLFFLTGHANVVISMAFDGDEPQPAPANPTPICVT